MATSTKRMTETKAVARKTASGTTKKTTETARTKTPATKKTTTIKASATAEASPEATKSTSTTTANTAPPQITHEMIALRAYHIWLGSGRPHGLETTIWLQAETELKTTATY